ncbi:hypothetical protein HII31_02695 [Pseudocercospora fuligena]|uniref:Uncharacterized protein n=1 Tax=Pseudocercospora fuligena TaxID=685502 RepID=A0A8H6RRC3_9PEZI|nr:hypothetical protein HII31_02695 [Pseudocercospora fuligena]
MARVRQEPCSAQVDARKSRPQRATGTRGPVQPDNHEASDANADPTSDGNTNHGAGAPPADDLEPRIRAHLHDITAALNNQNGQHALSLYHAAFQEFALEGTIYSTVERYIDKATLRCLETEAEESIQASKDRKHRQHAHALARSSWELSTLKIWCLFSHNNKWPSSAFLGGLRDLSDGEPDLSVAVKLMQDASDERWKARDFKTREQHRSRPRSQWIPFTKMDAHLAIEMWGRQTGRSTLQLSNFSKDPSRPPQGESKSKRQSRRGGSMHSQPEKQPEDAGNGGRGEEDETQQGNGAEDPEEGEINGGETQPQDGFNEPGQEDDNEDSIQQQNDSYKPGAGSNDDEDDEDDVPTPERGRREGRREGREELLDDMSTEMSYTEDTILTFGDEQPDSSPLNPRRRSENHPSTSSSAEARLRLMQEPARRPQKERLSSSFSTGSWFHFRRAVTNHTRVTRARSECSESSFRLSCGGNDDAGAFAASTPADARLQLRNIQHDEVLAANAIVQMATSLDPAGNGPRKAKRPRLTYDPPAMKLQPWLDVLASNDSIAAPAALLQHANVDSAILNHNGPGTAIIVLQTVPATSDDVEKIAFADISPSRITVHLPSLDDETNDQFTAILMQLKTFLPPPPTEEDDAQQSDTGQVHSQPVNLVALPFSNGEITNLARVLIAVAYHLSSHIAEIPDSLNDSTLWPYAAALCVRKDPATTAIPHFGRPYLDSTPPTPFSSHAPLNADMTFSCNTLRTFSAECTQRLQRLEQAAAEASRIRGVFRRPQDRTAAGRNQADTAMSAGQIDHLREKIRLAEEDLVNGDPHSPTRSLDVTRLDALKVMLQQQLATKDEQTARIERRQVIVKELAADMEDYRDEAKSLRSDLAHWRQQWLDFASSL